VKSNFLTYTWTSNLLNRLILSNSIFWIHVMIRFIGVGCTCRNLYCSAESLSMGFTIPRTRLVHDHLRLLSCQRLGPPATLTTWPSLLYVSLTDSLVSGYNLTWILIPLHTLQNTTIKSPKVTHGIMSSLYHIHTLTHSFHTKNNNFSLITGHKTYMASYFML